MLTELTSQHLGPDAPRVVAERDIKLHATIFDAKHAHVRLTQSGQLVGKDTTGAEWATLESDFLMNGFGAREKRPAALIETGTGNEAIVGGECSLDGFMLVWWTNVLCLMVL